MTSVTQVGKQLKNILQHRAIIVGKETGCIQRQRKFDGATLLQTFVFGWSQHPSASLEQLASMAQVRKVSVTDSAIHKRFTSKTATFLYSILQEMTQVIIQAHASVPLKLLNRFAEVVLEESSSITLPAELAEIWSGCGSRTHAATAVVKLHVCWELKTGQMWGPSLSDGRVNDRHSPFREQPLKAGGLKISDLGYFDVKVMKQRQQTEGLTLSRLHCSEALFTRQKDPLDLMKVLPRQVGQSTEIPVLVGSRVWVPMRLLAVRVPASVATQRRLDRQEEAKRRQRPVPEEAYRLADWTVMLTDVPRKHLSVTEALVLLRERWQIELLFKLWKSDGLVDEWVTDNPWRILCELYAKLIGLVIQHWLMVVFAWDNAQRSLVKLAQVVRDTGWTILEALEGVRSMRSALQTIGRRMQSGCSMNSRRERPNSAHLLAQGLNWAIP